MTKQTIKQTDELLKDLKGGDIKSYLKTNKNELTNKTLADYLNELLKEKNMTKKDIIRLTSISDPYIYQIFQGKRPNPSRNRLLSIAFAMKLNLDETQRLLKFANLGSLYPKRERDSVIIFCITRSMDIYQCTDLLEKCGLEPIIEDID